MKKLLFSFTSIKEHTIGFVDKAHDSKKSKNLDLKHVKKDKVQVEDEPEPAPQPEKKKKKKKKKEKLFNLQEYVE